MTTDIPASLPERLADAEGELPEEIEQAIDALVDAEHEQIKKGSRDADAWCEAAGVCHRARDALDATILARLAAAESAREALKAEIRDQAMRQLASDAGWELDWDKVCAERDAALARAERAEKDAARFRALMRCGRIKPQGSAGVNTKTGERTYPEAPGSVHFGAEFWVQPEAELSNMTIWGRHCLHALADDILAYEAAALAHPATAEET